MSLPIIVAAGGLVWNEKNELLMIFRRGKWDLPKGKLDDNETIETCAIREVKEETGLKNIELENFIGKTTHQYFDIYRKEEVLKESHWYAMKTSSNETLIAQTEEDITAIGWFTNEMVIQNLTNSFNNIIEILELYRRTKS